MALFDDSSTRPLSLLGLPDQVDDSHERDEESLFDLLQVPELLVELRRRAEQGTVWGPWQTPRAPRRRRPWAVDPFRKKST